MSEPDAVLGRKFPAFLSLNAGGLSVHAKTPATNPKGGGGLRGVVTKFSASSRRRMASLLMQIPIENLAQSGKRAKSAQLFFVTLTYGQRWPNDWERYKNDLRAFRERLTYWLHEKGIHYSCIWKLEYQKRGAPHFHLLVYLTKPFRVSSLLAYVASKWVNIASKDFDYPPEYIKTMLRVHTGKQSKTTGKCVLPVYDDGSGRVRSYLLKYMSKESENIVDENTGEILQTGRTWGIWFKGYMPMSKGVVFAFNSWREFDFFMREVRLYGDSIGSAYIGSLSGRVPFKLYGSGVELLSKLLAGLPPMMVQLD